MHFLLQLLVTTWFAFLLYVTFKVATIKAINEGKGKPTPLDVVLLILCFTIVLYGSYSIWFGIKYEL